MKKITDKINHLIAHHEIIATVIIAIICCSIYTLLFLSQSQSIVLIVGGNLLLAFLCWRYATYRKYAIINKAFDELDRNCDPYPLLNETTELLKSIAHSKDNTQMFIMYQHNALSHAGQYEKAYGILCSMQPEKMSKKFLESMAILKYYYMFSICDKMKRDKEADEWYEKMMEIYDRSRDPLTASRVGRSIENARLINMCRKGEFEEALEIMNEGKAETNLAKVLRAMRYARIYIGMGDTEQAREQLEYVIENGGKLYYVERARELIAGLEEADCTAEAEETEE